MTRPVPFDAEIERGLLTTICAPGAESALSQVVPMLREGDFLVPAHKRIFRAVATLLRAGNEVSLLAIQDELGLDHRHEAFEALDGEEVGRPTALVGILQRLRKQRELIAMGAKLYRDADSRDPMEFVAEVTAQLASMAQSTQDGNIEAMAEFSDDALASVLDRVEGRSSIGTKIHGWNRVNGLTHGLQPGQLIVLAARPGIGKTALALNWLLRSAENGHHSAIFSLEMPKNELWTRMVSDKAGVNFRDMIGAHDRDAFVRFAKGKVEVDALPIHVGDRAKITVPEIAAQVDRLITRHGQLGLCVIDYLQLLSSAQGSKSQNETTRIGEITRELKIVAKDRHIPIVLLSQLNREVEKRSGGKPQLSDLRDSGCVEQDADIVMFIHRQMQDTTAELIFAKHRNGPCVNIPIQFLASLTRYVEIDERTTQPALTEPLPLDYLEDFS